MWPLLSKPLYISMRRRKIHFLVHKVIKKIGQFGDPAQFSDFCHQTPCENTNLFVWKHERIQFKWKKSGKVKNLYGNVKDV